jgi:hypothetical protein
VTTPTTATITNPVSAHIGLQLRGTLSNDVNSGLGGSTSSGSRITSLYWFASCCSPRRKKRWVSDAARVVVALGRSPMGRTFAPMYLRPLLFAGFVTLACG